MIGGVVGYGGHVVRSAAAITVGEAWFRLREPAEVALEWQCPDGTWCAVTNDGSVRVWIPADRGQPPRWSRTTDDPSDSDLELPARFVAVNIYGDPNKRGPVAPAGIDPLVAALVEAYAAACAFAAKECWGDDSRSERDVASARSALYVELARRLGGGS